MSPISEAELKARSEAIQKRTMTLPPTQLPGVSVNGSPPKPLPAGIQPKASTAMPKGVTPASAMKPGENDALNGSNTGKDMDTGKAPALPSGGPAAKRSASIVPVEAPATRRPETKPPNAEPKEGAKPGEAPNTQAPVVKP